MNGLDELQHSEAVAQTVAWARAMLAAHPDDGDRYWLTPEGQEVIAIAECEGLV